MTALLMALVLPTLPTYSPTMLVALATMVSRMLLAVGRLRLMASGNATVTLGYEPQYMLMKLNVHGAVEDWVT
jgi:hypothetical protein